MSYSNSTYSYSCHKFRRTHLDRRILNVELNYACCINKIIIDASSLVYRYL